MDEPAIGPEPISIARFVPAFRLVRAIGVSFDGRSMILATAGLILLWAGWSGLDAAFGGPELASMASPGLSGFGSPEGPLSWGQAWRASRPFVVVISPFVRLFSMEGGFRRFAHAALAGVWCVVVWGIAGGAISRVAALRLCRGDRVGISSALRFAIARAVALIGAPLSPLIGIGFFAALCGLMGLLYRVPGMLSAGVAGALAFLPILAGLVMSLILAGMAVGWPLMIATVSVEGEDAFDALSRSYSYVYQRPAHYASYAVMAWALGWAGSLVVWTFAALVLHMAEWGLAFGGPSQRVMAFYGTNQPGASTADALHWFWTSLVRWLAHAWLYSYFWTAATMIYLLMRQDVDGAPFHDVAGSGEADEAFVPDPPPAEKAPAGEA